MEKEWDILLEASGANTPFLTWEWMWTWWEVYGSSYQLCLLEVVDETGTRVGLAPFKIASRHYKGFPYRQVEFIGYGGPENSCPDYLDIIIAPGFQEQVVKAVWAYFIDHKDAFDIFRFTDIPSASPTVSFLKNQAKESGYLSEREEGTRCPYVPIRGRWEDYFKSLTRKNRYNLRQREQNLQKTYGLTFDIIKTRPELDKAMEALFVLHRGVWNTRGETGSFDHHPFNRQFHLRLMERMSPSGGVVIYTLKVHGALAAVLYAYPYHNRVFYYQIGRDTKWFKYSIGRVLIGSILQSLFKKGAYEFDFLRGTETYKYDWTKLEHLNIDLTIWNKNAYAKLLHFLIRIWRLLRPTARAFRRMIKKACPPRQ
jgi:CelD/BcsL family acetyltransferase involved in cellulose biosynthesis